MGKTQYVNSTSCAHNDCFWSREGGVSLLKQSSAQPNSLLFLFFHSKIIPELKQQMSELQRQKQDLEACVDMQSTELAGRRNSKNERLLTNVCKVFVNILGLSPVVMCHMVLSKTLSFIIPFT